MDGRQDLEQTFRTAVQTQPKPQAYRETLYKLTQSTIGWVFITFVLTFFVLYIINPPFVQCHRNDNDMSRPAPNYSTIGILSGLSGIVVWGITWYNTRKSG